MAAELTSIALAIGVAGLLSLGSSPSESTSGLLEETKPGLFIAKDYAGNGTLFVDTRNDEPAIYTYCDGKPVNLPSHEYPESVKVDRAHVAAKGTAKLFDFTREQGDSD